MRGYAIVPDLSIASSFSWKLKPINLTEIKLQLKLEATYDLKAFFSNR